MTWVWIGLAIAAVGVLVLLASFRHGGRREPGRHQMGEGRQPFDDKAYFGE